MDYSESWVSFHEVGRSLPTERHQLKESYDYIVTN